MKLTVFQLIQKVEKCLLVDKGESNFLQQNNAEIKRLIDFRNNAATLQIWVKNTDDQIENIAGHVELQTLNEQNDNTAFKCRAVSLETGDSLSPFIFIRKEDSLSEKASEVAKILFDLLDKAPALAETG